MKMPQVYEIGKDKFKDVTQEWCDDAQKSMNKLGLQRDIIKRIININVISGAEKLTKISQFLLTLEV